MNPLTQRQYDEIELRRLERELEGIEALSLPYVSKAGVAYREALLEEIERLRERLEREVAA
jgi:hypothetical protein